MASLKTVYDKKIVERIDKFLAAALPKLSRTDVQHLIASGNLSINGQTVRLPAQKVGFGDKILFRYQIPDFLQAKPGPLEIKYENANLLIVDKPAGTAVYATAKNDHSALLNQLLAKYPELKRAGEKTRPGIVHRLDKQTSGLLIVAKNNDVFNYLKNLFATRKINKEYLALVYGRTPRHGLIEKPLTKIGQSGRSKVLVDEKGRKAITEYWAVGYYRRPLPQPLPKSGEGGRRTGEVEKSIDSFTLVKVKLHTGRTHQIRVHFSSEGHPVMGDTLYGKPQSLKLKDILSRQFLHASRLEFRLPDGTWLEVELGLPSELDRVLQILSTKS